VSKIIGKYCIEGEIEFLDLIQLNKKQIRLYQFTLNTEKNQYFISSDQGHFQRREH
jgi:hypothetical protein